jgi:hypothetical protein
MPLQRGERGRVLCSKEQVCMRTDHDRVPAAWEKQQAEVVCLQAHRANSG